MNFSDFFLMRHEIVLTIIALIILVCEIFTHDDKKHPIMILALVLFGLHTVFGFAATNTGELFGGSFRNTQMTLLMKNILNIGILIILFQSFKWLRTPENAIKISEFYIILFSSVLGMYVMISSGDFLMMYLGLETATIPLAGLAAYDRYKEKSAEAGVKLILSSALSSGILLYGISMIYGTTGTFYFPEIAAKWAITPLQVVAFIFFFAGMAFKISIVPFHLWTADVYEGSPISVTGFLSVISKGAAVFILITILFTVFKSMAPMWKEVIWATSVITMTLGNLFAIRQQNLKRFLAFSSIAQAGFIFLGIIAGTQLGMTSVVYFVLIYIFSNLGAFGVVAAIYDVTGKETIDDYNGLYRTNPNLSLMMLVSLFSLAGIPPVAGFFGKFFLFTAAAQGGSYFYYILVLIALLNTVISLYYYLLVVKAMFLNRSENAIAYFKSDWSTKTALLLCLAGIVITGLASPIFSYIQSLSFGL